VFLPRAPIEGVSPIPADLTGLTRKHRKGAIILLVDDDSAVREVTASMLRELGYVVLEVGSGGAALELLDRQATIDLVVLDFAMPGMNGMELAREVNSKFPRLPILFVTGYADETALEELSDAKLVKKPFVGDELADKVHAALADVGRSGKIIPMRR
jgi:CheY-like chemotaxis protein